MGVDDAVDDEFLGWGSNLPEETTVVVVPGHHYTVLSEPGLSGISERLVEMLDTIESTMGTGNDKTRVESGTEQA